MQTFIDASPTDIISTIESVLPDRLERVLFNAFLSVDVSIDCRVGVSDVIKIFRIVFPNATESHLEQLTYQVLPYQANELHVTFPEILQWWRGLNHMESGISSPPSKPQKAETWLREFAALTLDARRRAVMAYKTLLFDINVLSANLMSEEDMESERHDGAKVNLESDLPQGEALAIENFVQHLGNGDILPVERLGDLANLMGDDVPMSLLDVARKVYGNELTVEDVQIWWVLRKKESS